jgi:PEP-CTERM motif
MSFTRSGYGGLTLWKGCFAAVVVLALALVNRSYAVDALVSSWEGPASESDGQEFIYDSTTQTSTLQNTHYFDGWFPYPSGTNPTYPFGNADLFTYNTDGASRGTQALEISRNSGYFSLQRNFGGAANQQAFINASSVKLDITYDVALMRNFDNNPNDGFANFDMAINTPLGFVDVPRTKTRLDINTFQTVPTGTVETVGPNPDPHFSGASSIGEYDRTAAIAAGNPITHDNVSLNLWNPDFVVTNPAPAYAQYNGMQYMQALRQATQNGTNIPAGFYIQADFAIQANYAAYFPNNGDPTTPDGNAVSFLVDNFRVQSNIFGDFNQNGVIDGFDVQAGLLALKNESAYEAAHDLSQADLDHFGDVNGDGVFDIKDIIALQKVLAGKSVGGGSITGVPEPASLCLLGLGGALVIAKRWRRPRAG